MKNKFSQNLKELRILANMSQKDIAHKLNISNKTLSHWEQGYSEPNLELLLQLKDLLGVTYEDLLE